MTEWRSDIENAPRDGRDVLFPVEFTVRAYWDDELRRWVTVRTMTIDSIRNPTRWREA